MSVGQRTARGTARRAGRGGRKAARSEPVKRLGRLGFTAKGAIYVLVGVIALGVALGARNDPEAQSGALATLADAPLGKLLLILLAVGLGAYALWRLAIAIVGPPGKSEPTEPAERVGSLVLALVYGALCAYAVGIVIGAGTTNGASTGPDEATRLLLDQPLGTALVIAVGLVLAGLAVYEAYKAISRSFLNELRTSKMSARERRIATALGIAGHAARAAVSGLVAAFVIKAAIEHDPSEAVGMDGALQKLATSQLGTLLLGIVAAGLVTYGLYLLVEARHRRV